MFFINTLFLLNLWKIKTNRLKIRKWALKKGFARQFYRKVATAP